MIVRSLRVNGVKNPVGFDFEKIKVSWKVEDAKGKYQNEARIIVSTDEQFKKIVLEKKGENLSSIGEELELKVEAKTRYYIKVEVTDETGDKGESEVHFFETAKMAEPWSAKFIKCAAKDKFHPVFIKRFEAKDKIKKAKLYIMGLGLYEAYINGEKVGNDYMAPFCTDYSERIQYQTYDIKDILSKKNEINVFCGNGWYKGNIGYEGQKELFGNEFKMIAEIEIEYENGKLEKIVSDDSWTYKGSDIELSDNYDGETINRLLWKNKENPEKKVVVSENDGDVKKLVPRYSVPVCLKETMPVKEVIETPKGECVLDFGQNFAGIVEFDADFKEGSTVTFEASEILQDGNFYNDNYRDAKAKITYVSDGRKEHVRPHFTFCGFRYVRVCGWPGKLDASKIMGRAIYSDLDETIKFNSSNERLNRLALNCIWGQKSNFLDMPTDCPQRNERLAWTGDANVFAPTACYNMDVRAFYDKFLTDLRIDQQKNGGAVAGYLPDLGGNPRGSSVWADAATFIPMTLYYYYGDKDILVKHYPLMRDWALWIMEQDKNNGNKNLWNFGFHFGDWLAQDGVTDQSMKGGTDDGYIASMFYYQSVLKCAQAAGIIGKEEDCNMFSEKAEKIYNAILDEYFSKNGRLCIDTQTAYILALKFNVYVEKSKIIEGLKVRLKKDCYRIKGGFVGATSMCQVLAENGFADVAYHVLLQNGYPGWMYCINLGATTIWERWNSVLADGKISGTGMNSLNHYSYGSVMEFVYKNIAGIRAKEPGFKEVIFEPQLNNKLREVSLEYDSISGKYASSWKINDDGTVTLRFEVPFGCGAEAYLPGTKGEKIELEPGVFEKTYKPAEDYLSKYNMNTRLEEVVDDKEAMEILKEDLPTAFGLAMSGDIENLSLSFNEMMYMFFMGFNPELIQKGTKRLFKLKI